MAMLTASKTAGNAIGQRLLLGRRIWQHTIDAYWISNVLNLAIAQRLVGADQFVFDLLVNAARDVDVSGIRNSLKADRNVNAIAVNLRGSNKNNVAEMDAYPI
jgi:hypothetical protein